MTNQWFRMYSEFSTDPKVQSMPEHMQRRLVMIFCMQNAGMLHDVTNVTGVTSPLHETYISFFLRINDDELAKTKEIFISKGFIDNDWNVLNWDKRQFAESSSAERVRRYRERKKQENVTQCNTGNVTVTVNSNPQKQSRSRADTEAEKKEKLKEKKLSTSSVAPPVQPSPAAVPVANSSPPVPPEEVNLNDFANACAVLACLLGWQRLTPKDQELVAVWCGKYDIRREVLPCVEGKLKSFVSKQGKPPNSLAYFDKLLSENVPMLAADLGKKWKVTQ